MRHGVVCSVIFNLLDSLVTGDGRLESVDVGNLSRLMVCNAILRFRTWSPQLYCAISAERAASIMRHHSRICWPRYSSSIPSAGQKKVRDNYRLTMRFNRLEDRWVVLGWLERVRADSVIHSPTQWRCRARPEVCPHAFVCLGMLRHRL